MAFFVLPKVCCLLADMWQVKMPSKTSVIFDSGWSVFLAAFLVCPECLSTKPSRRPPNAGATVPNQRLGRMLFCTCQKSVTS
jgi:hypothetical protein